ncbi:hypothetical protein BCR39DRAFT_517227 [Naematelia encephala]|uniref:Uncharacterized protein n=1 Tax=Naematelia encephala TaxID=71784 RepID=A0A1Y2BI48_9TREE|nr:hypothetical protein BCR39DRAFT_517227 [Naematelia encephala]
MIGGGTGLFLIATAFLSGANISRTAAIMTIACGSTYGVLHEVVEKTRNKLERPRPTEETLMTAFNADETTATTPTTSTASPASSREGSIAPVSEDLTRGDGGSDIGAQRSDDTTDESEEEEVLTMLTTTSSRW